MNILRREVRYRFQLKQPLIQIEKYETVKEANNDSAPFSILCLNGIIHIFSSDRNERCITVFIYDAAGQILEIKVLKSEQAKFSFDLKSISEHGKSLVITILTPKTSYSEKILFY